MRRKLYTKAMFVERYKRPLEAQRRCRLEYFRSITPKVAPADTIGMVREELALLWSADHHPEAPNKMWPILTRLARAFTGTNYVRTVHAERRRLLALLQRLMDEGKVGRFRRQNSIFLTDLGYRRLYALRGIEPWKPGDPVVVPAGPSLDEFLTMPDTFPICEDAADPPPPTAPAAGPEEPAPTTAWTPELMPDFRRFECPRWRPRVYVV